MLVVASDVAFAGLTVYGIKEQRKSLWLTGAAGLLFAPSLIHLAHGQTDKIPLSMSSRAIIPAGGMVLGGLVGILLGSIAGGIAGTPAEDGQEFDDDAFDRVFEKTVLISAGIGAVAGTCFGLLLDYANSRREVGTREPIRSPEMSRRVIPTLAPARGGLHVGVVGSF